MVVRPSRSDAEGVVDDDVAWTFACRGTRWPTATEWISLRIVGPPCECRLVMLSYCLLQSTVLRRLYGEGGHMPADQPRKRHPHGELKTAMREYLASRGGPASIKKIKAAIEPKLGERPDSSYRSGLQDERYFERVARGVFRLRPEA